MKISKKIILNLITVLVMGIIIAPRRCPCCDSSAQSGALSPESRTNLQFSPFVNGNGRNCSPVPPLPLHFGSRPLVFSSFSWSINGKGFCPRMDYTQSLTYKYFTRGLGILTFRWNAVICWELGRMEGGVSRFCMWTDMNLWGSEDGLW